MIAAEPALLLGPLRAASEDDRHNGDDQQNNKRAGDLAVVLRILQRQQQLANSDDATYDNRDDPDWDQDRRNPDLPNHPSSSSQQRASQTLSGSAIGDSPARDRRRASSPGRLWPTAGQTATAGRGASELEDCL